MRKKVDSRVRILVENAVATRQRAMFVLIGDRGKDQVVNLHYMLSKITTRKPSVLWCYKDSLGFSSHRKKRMKQLKKKIQQGLFDPNIDDPFELFISSTRIRYCYYKETDAILGQTFGMCVLQDFETLTPNILCRTLETVEGGGIICILLRTLSSLKQLYAMTVFQNATKELHLNGLSSGGFRNGKSCLRLRCEPKFNERFILSLANCSSCLIVDDELNILPVSRHAKAIAPLGRGETLDQPVDAVSDVAAPVVSKKPSSCTSGPPQFELVVGSPSAELAEVKRSLKDSAPAGPLVGLAVTLDQAKVLLSFMEIISEKALTTTLALTAARGRGKSATLGLTVASAFSLGYSNIFITAPSPENIGTIFEFAQKGLVALGYKEHQDFELIEGEVVQTSPISAATAPSHTSEETPLSNGFRRQVVRINVFRDHRQTMQYIAPTDVAFARQAEILVIDEAAAIPLPTVSRLMGPYLVFLSSTVNGYEGTGRALSLKLIKDLKEGRGDIGTGTARRSLREFQLSEPIRYAQGDTIEAWMTKLLCLDAATPVPLRSKAFPLPSQCQLYEVNREALFSYHRASEQFLHKLMSLFVSSHYKNTPNDLLLLADAPAHEVFVLLPPVSDEDTEIPDVYVAIHVAVEGAISKEAIREALQKGQRPSGDLLPWTLSQNFIDEDFGSLNGARIVRVATHPALQRLGYGSEALRQLVAFFERRDDQCVTRLTEIDGARSGGPKNVSACHPPSESSSVRPVESTSEPQSAVESVTLHNEVLKPRDAPPLLAACADMAPSVPTDYIGVSYGLTLDLFRFYDRAGFVPVYLRQSPNEITGEHSTIMLRVLGQTSDCSSVFNWIQGFSQDFKNRFSSLLGSSFRNLSVTLALSVMASAAAVQKKNNENDLEQDGKNWEDGQEGCQSAGMDMAEQTSRPTAAITRSEGGSLPKVTHKTIHQFLTRHDILRLERYGQQLLERSMVRDLIPTLATLLLTDRLPAVAQKMSYAQMAVLLGVGLQNKSMEAVAKELNISTNQVTTLFNKSIHKINTAIQEMLTVEALEDEEQENKKAAERIRMMHPNHLSTPDPAQQSLVDQLPTNTLPTMSFEDELETEAKDVKRQLAQKRAMLTKSLENNAMVKRYTVANLDEADVKNQLNSKVLQAGGTISIARKKRRCTDPDQENQGFHIQQSRKEKVH